MARVVIRAPRRRPPRPSTIGYSDRDGALALHPNWPLLCTHQAFHTSNRIVRSARPSMARTRRSWAGTASRRLSHTLAPQFCLVESSRGAGPAADLHRRGARRGEQAMREAFTGRHAANGPRVSAQNTDDSESCLSRSPSGASGAKCQSPAGPRDPQDLDWSRESSASQTTSARMRSAKKTLWELCTAIPIQALR